MNTCTSLVGFVIPARREKFARMLGVVLFGLFWLAAMSDASAQGQKIVDGVAVNLGWISAADAAKIQAERGIHPSHVHQKGVYHMVVSLADAQTGKSIRNASVTAIISDPFDRNVRKPLKKAETAGYTDFSDYYEFGVRGRYFVNLEIMPEGRTKPLKVQFQKDYAGI